MARYLNVADVVRVLRRHDKCRGSKSEYAANWLEDFPRREASLAEVEKLEEYLFVNVVNCLRDNNHRDDVIPAAKKLGLWVKGMHWPVLVAFDERFVPMALEACPAIAVYQEEWKHLVEMARAAILTREIRWSAMIQVRLREGGAISYWKE